MIRIRYACLPEGLYATAVARSRHTTIYLRPGLEPWQRRDALQRLRRNARLGYAPPLPPLPLARALLADQVLSTFRALLAALQCHPLGALGLAGMLAGAAVSYMTLVTCPVQSGTAGQAGVPAPAAGPAGGTGLVTADLVPLATKPGHWRIPDARPHGEPAPGGAAATPGWQPGPGERGPGERGPGERGPGERGPGERGPGERGPGERGAAQPGGHRPGHWPRPGGQWRQRYGWLWARRGWPSGTPAQRGWPSGRGGSGYPPPGQYPERPAPGAHPAGCAPGGTCHGLPGYRKAAW